MPRQNRDAFALANLCLRQHHIESSRPGGLLAQDTFCVVTLKGLARSTFMSLSACTAVMLLKSPSFQTATNAPSGPPRFDFDVAFLVFAARGSLPQIHTFYCQVKSLSFASLR